MNSTELKEDPSQWPRTDLLRDIIEKELIMFLSTPNEGGTASCQQRPDSFRIMRWMAHSVHSDATLLSYHEDLRMAENTGRNFMIEKYALMDGLIPPISQNPLIEIIAAAEAKWMEEAALRYPKSLQSRGDDVFKRYISSELQTLSDHTLEMYAKEVQQALDEGRNLIEDRHTLLCKKMGYGSLAERESSLSKA